MYQEKIYDEAIRRIQARRIRAQEQQERRTEQIRAEIPETAELDRQLRTACLSIVQALKSEDRSERLKKLESHCLGADAMLRKILTAHGYPADYLDTQYTCKRCSDTGFVSGKPCECLEREIGIVGAEQLNAQSRLALCSFESFSLAY